MSFPGPFYSAFERCFRLDERLSDGCRVNIVFMDGECLKSFWKSGGKGFSNELISVMMSHVLCFKNGCKRNRRQHFRYLDNNDA